MALTPLDIHNKEFSKSLRGYNPDEVSKFLDQVVQDYESTIKENIELKEKLEQVNNKIEHYQNMEETLHNAIVVAQESAEKVKENAEEEATLIKQKARDESDKMIDEARQEVNNIQRELEYLKNRASAFKIKFRSLLQSHLEMLEEDPWKELTSDIQEKENDYQPVTGEDHMREKNQSYLEENAAGLEENDTDSEKDNNT